MSCHFSRLFHSHQLDQCRNDISKHAVLSELIFRIRIHQNEGNRIGRMGCMRLAGLIVDHLLAVSVIRADEHLAADLLQGFHCASHTGVNGLHRFDSRFDHAGVSNHIRVRKVDDDHIVLSGQDGFGKTVADFRCAHLRLKIIGGYLRGFDQDTVFSLVRLFDAAVEEESNMGIFLGLGDTGLSHVVSRQILAEGVCQMDLFERYQFVRDGGIIVCKAYIRQVQTFLSRETGELIVAECAGDLAGTVRTEVEEYDGIILGNDRYRLSILLDDRRKNELIRNAFVIGSLYGDSRIMGVARMADYAEAAEIAGYAGVTVTSRPD